MGSLCVEFVPESHLTMSAAFGLWRAGLISNRLFAAGVAAVVLALLAAHWLSGWDFWAPDGAYSRCVSPIIGIVWVLIASRCSLDRSPATDASMVRIPTECERRI